MQLLLGPLYEYYMMSCFLQEQSDGHPLPMWQKLLSHAISEKADALIDCGALLAGVSNRCASFCAIAR